MGRLPEAIVTLTRLRDTVASVGADYTNVRPPDPTVCVEILPEIGACHGLVQLTLNERLIGPVNQTTSVRVTHEEAKQNVSMRLSVTVDVLRMQSHNLCSGNTGELCRHAVATECNWSDRGRPA